MKANYPGKEELKYSRFLNLLFISKISKVLSLVIILISFIIPCFTYAQVNYEPVQKWKWLHPQPTGASFRWCKAWDNNNWYAAGQYGTFMKTSNGGASWSIFYNAVRSGGPIVDLTGYDYWDAHFFNQNTGIFVTTSNVFRTTNAGSNLVTFDSIPGVPRTAWRKIFFLNDNTGYIAGYNGKLAKTTNRGDNWTAISSISSINHLDVWTPDDTLLIVSSADGFIQRSTNSGTSWTTISTGSSSYLQKLFFLNRDTGIVCGQLNTVLLTTNGGLNWININSNLAAGSNYIDIDYRLNGGNREIYLTGNAQYIYKTTNLGTSWDTIGIFAPNQQNMGIFQRYLSTELLGGDTLLTVGSFGLVNKINSPSERILFTSFVKFGGSAHVTDIWAENGKIIAVGYPTTAGLTFDQIIYSSNDGSSWVAASIDNSIGGLNSLSMPGSNTGYTAGTGGRIMKTVNGGMNWFSLTSPVSGYLHKIEFADNNTGWVFSEAGEIHKTTDGGTSWNLQIQQPNGFYFVDAEMLNANTGWFTGSSSIFQFFINKTTNGGDNWVQQYYSTTQVFLCVKVIDANTAYFAGANIMKTTNGGASWDSIPLPILNPQITGMDFVNSQTGILLGNYYTIKTTTGGSSWILDYTGGIGAWSTAGTPSKIKMTSADIAYFGGLVGDVLKYESGAIGIIEWENTVPKQFRLFQNYPNPFNPSTTIKFELPKAGNVTLKAFDITGREVSTLINNMSLNRGTVTHRFDGSKLASGIYFYSLYVDGSWVDSKKMILVK